MTPTPEKPKPNGRKYTLTRVGLALTTLVMAGCFTLAAFGKLTADMVQVVTIYFPSVAGLISIFNGSNAFVSGKALDSGAPPPEGT